MSKRCRARTKAGGHCKAAALKQGLCAFHADPKRAARLGRMGGQKNRRHLSCTGGIQMRPPQSAKEVRDVLAATMADVHAGRLEPSWPNESIVDRAIAKRRRNRATESLFSPVNLSEYMAL